MAFNPFITDRPLAPEEMIGREEEARRLVELAEGGHNSVLSGPRRYGKTSLLGKVLENAGKIGMVTVSVDFYGVVSGQAIAARLEEAYRGSLQGPLARWYAGVVRTWSPRLRLGSLGAGPGIEAGPRPEAEATRLLAHLLDLPVGVFEKSGRRTLVAFDEFQALLAADDGIDGLIRSRIQKQRKEASYIFAGSEPGLLAQLFADRERPLFGQARPLRLGALPEPALADYIGRRFEETNRDVAAALEPLLELVRGHPQRAMLLAHHLWDLTPKHGSADAQMWTAALAAVFRELQEAFERTWEALRPNERRGLAAVAWTGPWGGGDSLYSRSTLARFKLSKSAAQYARRALVKRGELVETETGGPQLVDPLFEAWIASEGRPRF